MLPGAFAESWCNLRPSFMKLSGAFTKANETQSDLWIGEFHAEMTLDDGEKIRAIFPEAISLPTEHATYLLCDSQYLLAGYTYHSDLRTPKLELKQGGTYTMDVIAAHKILHMLPICATTQTNHRTVLFHLPTHSLRTPNISKQRYSPTSRYPYSSCHDLACPISVRLQGGYAKITTQRHRHERTTRFMAIT